jgi:hypothetical protein
MFRLSPSINAQLRSQKETQPYLWQFLKAFWRFSQFYGNYHSIAPSQRRRFVDDFTKNDSA